MKISHENVKSENIKRYNAEAAAYDRLHPEIWNWYEQKRHRRLVEETLKSIPANADRVIVDIGAGTGNLTTKYLKHGCSVISVDISGPMLEVLEGKLNPEEKRRCRIICADIESALKDMPDVDGICFSSVLHHLYDYKDIIKDLTGKINRGGFFLNVHDPLIQEPKSRTIYRIHRILRGMDEYFYHRNVRRMGYDLREFGDDRIAEYHQRGGTFDHCELRTFLEGLGLSVAHFETYTSRRYGLFGWLATEVFGAENSFSFIARKV